MRMIRSGGFILFFMVSLWNPRLSAIEAFKGEYFIDDTTKVWDVNPSEFEFSMTIIGMISANSINETEASFELGAFFGENVRGSARPTYIPDNDSYVFFLTVFGNQIGDTIRFMLYDHENEGAVPIEELREFMPDTHSGEILNPIPFTISTTSTSNIDSNQQDLKVFPNPTWNYLNVESEITIQYLQVYNMTGQVLLSIYLQNQRNIDVSSLPSGKYIMKAGSNQGEFSQVFIKL